MAKAFLWLHLALIVFTVCLLGLAFSLARPTNQWALLILLVQATRFFAGFSLVAGLVAMAMRRQKSESILLAISTVASFLLLLLVLDCFNVRF
jgi:hypothetical protein